MQKPSLILSALTIAVTLLAGCAAQTSSPPASANGTAVEMNSKEAGTRHDVIRRALAPALYEIIYSARQHALFVASAGGIEADAPAARILRLDPVTLAVEAEILLERPGLGLALDDEADRLYIGNAFHASITVLDTRDNHVEGVIQLAEQVDMINFDGKPTRRYPHNLRELVVDRENHRLFAPGIWIKDSVLYVVDTQSMTLEKVIPGFGFGAAGATLDKRTGQLYVSNMQGQLHTLDSRTLEKTQVAEIEADQLLNLAFDTRLGRVLATDQGSDQPDMVREKLAKLDYQIRGDGNRVVVIDPAEGRLLHSIPTGQHPVALLIDSQRHLLYVTNRGTGTITVHDSDTYRLLHTFELPAHPNSLALDPASGAIYATIKNDREAPRHGNESVVRIMFDATGATR